MRVPASLVLTSVIAGAIGATVGFLANLIARWGLRDVSVRVDVLRIRILLALAGAVTLVCTTIVIGSRADLLAWWWFASCAVVLARGDVLRHRLPDRLVAPALAGGIVLLAGAAVAGGAMPDLARAFVCAVIVGLTYLALAVIAPSGLGMGDVKLAPLVGLYLGWLSWVSVVEGVMAGFVIGALWALVLMATRRGGVRTHVPFGPSMLLGVAVAALLHDHV